MKKDTKIKGNKKSKTSFTSKANVLKILKEQIKKSIIENLYVFTVSEWQSNKTNVLNFISNNFESEIIVRSSAIGEDSPSASKAGSYTTIQKVNPNSHNVVKKAIELVINSYLIRGNKNSANQILVQNQTINIKTSGVVFTHSSDIGAPYYVINYEDSSITDGVTKGKSANTVKIFRNICMTKLPMKWRLLLKSIQEIEFILGSTFLDVEFCITNSDQVIIFQVRPMALLGKNKTPNLESKIEKIISINKRKFLRLTKRGLLKNHAIFSDMTDWNPAEIIGNNPNPLDYSIYDYIIMSKPWHQGRTRIGYQNVSQPSLMVKFGNKPYVDVRSSFNSLIPNKISSHVKEKLMSFYLEKLSKNSHLHDKVEFEILFTCYDMTLDSRMKELLRYGFSKKEIKEIKLVLINFTNQVIKNFPKISRECFISVKKMTKNRTKIKSHLRTSGKSYVDLLDAVDKLLKDCRHLGTVRFSTMARMAFIGSIILKSLVKKGYIDSDFFNIFMNSITTLALELRRDFASYCDNKLSKKQFLRKYGHLRAGTYDITALRYDQENAFFDIIKFLKPSLSKVQVLRNTSVSTVLSKYGLNFDDLVFFSFVKDSLKQREELKFEFTRNLSDALELIAQAGGKLGFSRTEMSYLDITTILRSYKRYTSNELKSLWRKKINYQKESKRVNSYLVLPPLIFSEKDFEVVNYYLSKPNYITTKTVEADLINLKNLRRNLPNIESKIILIENADPGYDWIFTKNPSGLITKYGGVASHMAIRCAEAGLPAAIGCGNILYEKLIESSKVLLDCKNNQIVILEYEKSDEYVEERKTLKSLGYIK